jgi:hypothetical protein
MMFFLPSTSFFIDLQLSSIYLRDMFVEFTQLRGIWLQLSKHLCLELKLDVILLLSRAALIFHVLQLCRFFAASYVILVLYWFSCNMYNVCSARGFVSVEN